MTVIDVVVGILGGIALFAAVGSAYWFGRSDGIEEAERRRFWTDRGEKP